MAVKVWNVGDVLTASDVNSWLAPLAGVKSADQTISAQTTFVNDADMRFAVAANSIYEFHVYFRFASPTGGDWKSSFTVPSGAAARFQRTGNNISGVFTGVTDWADTDSPTTQGVGAAVGSAGGNGTNVLNSSFTGVLWTASTAGNLIFQWAQNTSNAGNTTLFAHSYLTGRRIG